jgi:hypothetical protein
MAKKWCLEYGVLKWADAEVLCKELGISIVRWPTGLLALRPLLRRC